MTRKLASIQEITHIKPIPDADAIECAVVNGGWPVVVKKGEYKVGDLAIYLEIDSWAPHELAPFLSKGKEPREYNGVKGERLKTVKLRGQISQGLLLPLEHKPGGLYWITNKNGTMDSVQLGDDVTEALGVQKWEPPIPTQLQGTMKGNFPSFIPKTDQERVQNLGKHFPEYQTLQYELTEKLEGSSCTMYLRDGEFNVCSRNVNLKDDGANTYWQVARAMNMEQLLRDHNLEDFAFQMEVHGSKIQGNIYKMEGVEGRVFDIYNIKEGKYLAPKERRDLCEKLGIAHVPCLGDIELGNHTVESLVKMADGPSELNSQTLREGLVFKSLCGTRSFKAISNQYLLKSKI